MKKRETGRFLHGAMLRLFLPTSPDESSVLSRLDHDAKMTSHAFQEVPAIPREH